MLVLRIIFPTSVTRGSFGVVHLLFYADGGCTAMERNLYIWKGWL